MCLSLLKTLNQRVIPCYINKVMSSRQSSDFSKFRVALKSAKEIVILSGAGISAESGIPTFRGAGGLWRKYQASALATPGAFRESPSLVWEFYHYRREVAAKAKPNAVIIKQKSDLASNDSKLHITCKHAHSQIY